MESEGALLEVELCVDYPNKPQALRKVSFDVRRGEVLGLVGESGSGKSTIALALLRLLDYKNGKATGRIVFRDRDLMKASEREMRRLRGRDMGLVMQSPLASLNPALSIGRQLEEAWRAHGRGAANERSEGMGRALARVGLPADDEFRHRYPAQISVGQAQRVLIAMAVMHSPALLIADEPTSALDALTQVEILDMVAALNRDMGTSVLYISHDLQSVASICDRIAILREGEIVESDSTEAILLRPQHPYTQRLLSCAPWLRWWQAQLGRKRPLSRQCQAREGMADVRTAPVDCLSRLKSRCQPPIGY
ncbi:MAG TPA: ABC transporter ATP-binding protein [Candidatus Eisenbacteria bacterium]|nr:ABC transporter ATP-binding protein [Candidatus Eisenbacteria bacterium]